jgi:hypothetical protein
MNKTFIKSNYSSDMDCVWGLHDPADVAVPTRVISLPF